MFANYVSDKGPVSKINKEPSQFNYKKANDILKTKNTRGSCEKEPQACIFHKTHGDEKGWGMLQVKCDYRHRRAKYDI